MKRACLLLACCSLAVAMVLEHVYAQDYEPPYSYLVNCGDEGNITLDSRQWMGESSSSHLLVDTKTPTSPPILALAPKSTNTTISPLFSHLWPILSTARIFTSASAYSFPVASNDRYWIRLYFYPFRYQQFSNSSAVFSVTAGQHTLLHITNITDAVSGSTIGAGFLFKEYCINATSTPLEVRFIPDEAQGSYAFINALEVVSVPPDHMTDDTSPLGFNSPKKIGLPQMALETMYRVNVGGPFVSPANDSSGLYRTWLANESFIYTSAGVNPIYTSITAITYPSNSYRSFAPASVYSTALEASSQQTANPQNVNISFLFPVERADYTYVVRLHFCELVYGTGGKRHFDVYLQNQTAAAEIDLGGQFGRDTAYHRDFSLQAQGNLWVQAGPPPYTNDVAFTKAILNGIEIWKLNDTNGNLDGTGANALTSAQSSSKGKLAVILGATLGGLTALAIVFIVACLFCRQRRVTPKKQADPAWIPLAIHGGNSVSISSRKSGTGSQLSTAPSSLGRMFTFTEISEATQYFDESLVLGVGGFGKVYLGELDDGTKVAVKRANPQSGQGIVEFQTEIEMLSKLRHRHLVSLIGYCEERREMILVYEYMANGPLRSHLYGSDLPALSWMQRLEICIGAARGLHYLHTGAAQSIIHRDVKTTNILLDENFVAKVSDFGLSKTGPTLDHTHVTTAVKGSFGYLDPEYFRRQQLTEKSDVYSFGVVLLEVLCARPAINPALPREAVNIAEWALLYQRKGKLEEIVDPHLVGSINFQSLIKFGETAEKCLAEEGIYRPTIGDVLWNLEYCLQLQETSMATSVDDDSTNRISNLPVVLPVHERWEDSVVEEHSLAVSEQDSEDATGSAVFSQLMRPQGR